MQFKLLMASLACVTALLSSPNAFVFAAETTFSAATTDADGFLLHHIESDLQAGPTDLRVLLPDKRQAEERFPVVFVLPVEAGRETRYGDGLVEVQKQDLHNKHRAIFVAPSFFHLPWYANHTNDPAIAQQSYLFEVVLLVSKHYPIVREKDPFYLLGFSKSGWGAVSMLLKDPKLFTRAAAWDAPLMMDQLGKYGTTPIFGDQENFAKYSLPKVVNELYDPEQFHHKLILTGYGGFRTEMQQFHTLLEKHNIKHLYQDGPQRKHDWHSGWVAEAVELLLEKPSR